MRVEILQAIGLVVGLQAAGPLVAPTALDPGQLPGHLGEHVAVAGRVVEVSPGETVSRVRVAGDTGEALALVRGRLPPLGATVEIVGDAAAGDEGPIVWVEDPITVLETPDREPVPLEVLVEQAPERAGTTVAVVAAWDPDADTLTRDGASLPVRLMTAKPPPDEAIVAWGVLRYVPDEAGYRLDASGWEPWTPSPR